MAITHDYVLNFLRVRQDCDAEQLAPFLDENVDWLISGPVDFLPHCGHRKGKAAVIDMICRIAPDTFERREFVIDHLLVQGNHAATMSRFQGVRAVTKRSISYRSAHFMRFRDDKLIWFRSLIDSFSATEQFMGHELDLEHSPDIVSLMPNGDLVEI